MASVTIKNLPDNLYRKLKTRAKSNNRSINGEVVNLLTRELEQDHLDVRKILEQARLTQSWAKGTPLSDEEVIDLKKEGRE
jgi:plasmid stability protein